MVSSIPHILAIASFRTFVLSDLNAASSLADVREEGCKVKRKVEVEKFTGVNHFVSLKCFYHFDF